MKETRKTLAGPVSNELLQTSQASQYAGRGLSALFTYVTTGNTFPMKLSQTIIRLGLATVLLGSLGACVVVPAHQAGYHRTPPAYVETYPAYGYPRANIYYESGHRHYDDRGGRYYDDRRHDDRRSYGAPLPPPLQLHRDVRRSLGLPRLPGMP